VGSSKEAMAKYGIPCITPETGTPFPVKVDDVDWFYNGIINIMKLIGMMDGAPTLKKQPLDPVIEKVVAEHGGLWIQKMDSGSRVNKGDVVGEVVSLVGETLERGEAPCRGVICTTRTCVTVNQGDVLALVAKI
jgi:predicted deacylase